MHLVLKHSNPLLDYVFLRLLKQTVSQSSASIPSTVAPQPIVDGDAGPVHLSDQDE